MALDMKALRHPSETSRFLFALIVVIPLSLLAAVYIALTFGLLLLVLWLAFLFVRNLVYTMFIGNSVRVDDHNFPDIHRLSQEVCAAIEYDRPIDIFIYEEGSFNALLVPFLKRRAVILNSETVHGATETELRWLIGRFVGYLKGKKTRFMIFEIFLNSFERLYLFNVFLYPYERAAVLTGDRIGAYAANYDRAAVFSALGKLLVGPDIAGKLREEGLARQYQELRGKPIFSLLTRLYSPFPHMMRRYAELDSFFADTSGYPRTAPASAASPRPAGTPQDVEEKFRTERPFDPMPAAERTTHQAETTSFRSPSENRSGAPVLRILIGLIVACAAYAAGDYLLFGEPGDLPLGTLLFWFDSWDLDGEFGLQLFGLGFASAIIARLVGGSPVVPWLFFAVVALWTLYGVQFHNSGALGGIALNFDGLWPGALVLGAACLIPGLLPRFRST